MICNKLQVVTTQPRSLFNTNNTNVGNASSSTATSSSITISSDDCERAKQVCQKTLKYGAAAACFGAGYGAKALYDVFTNSSGRSPHNYEPTTTSELPFRGSGLGQMNDSYLDKLNNGKIW